MSALFENFFNVSLFRLIFNFFQVISEFMEILEKVSEEKMEQHLNASATSSQDLPYAKERIAMMSLILQRMLAQTGLVAIALLSFTTLTLSN